MTVVEAIFILEPTRTGPREGSERTHKLAFVVGSLVEGCTCLALLHRLIRHPTVKREYEAGPLWPDRLGRHHRPML